MPFRYRLQQVYNLRERKKKEQEQRVIQAQQKVREIELEIEEKNNEIRSVRMSMRTADHMMLNMHDQYLKKLNRLLKQLNKKLVKAQEELAYEKQLLVKAQAELEALAKHKEKMHEAYLEEEKRKEMKMLDEVAGQRYFRAELEKTQQELEDLETEANY